MRQMWKKMWHDLAHGWGNTYLNIYVATLNGGLWVGILNQAPETVAGIFILGLTLALAWAAPLQLDKAMHLCPMDRGEKRLYLLRYYWLRVGTCLGISLPVHLVTVLAGWQSLAAAGTEVLFLAAFSLAALSAGLPERCRELKKGGAGAFKTELGLNGANVGTVLLYFVMMVLIVLLHYAQQNFQEQEIFEVIILIFGSIVFVSAFAYVVRVLPRTLDACSDYESSCKYFRVE